MFTDKDFTSQQKQAFIAFHEASACFPSMWSLHDCVSASASLGNLWFREFYLELTKEVS